MKHTLTFLLFICPYILLAQSFKTSAPSTVSTGEQFYVRYVLTTNDADNYHCPPSNDFDVLSGPYTSSSSSFSFVNGKRSSSSSLTYTYILQAKRTGKLALPRPTVKVNGKTIQATAAVVNVVKDNNTASGNQSQPRSPQDDNQPALRNARSITQKDLFIRCIASRSNIYLQEPVAITYKVYARNGIDLNNITAMHKPELKGFWTQEQPMPSKLEPSYERIGGEMYRVFTYLQYLAFPQQAGDLTLAPLQTECSVLQNNPDIDPLDAFFNGGGTLCTQVRRNSPEITIHVKELPTPKPHNFSGGVGQFNVEGKLVSSELATNDVGTYRITISGNGNMRLIQAPHINFPKTFDTYDPRTTDQTHITSTGISGRITYDYTFVPREEGDFEIPASEFVFFDIQEGTYRTIPLNAIRLHIKKGLRSREEVERELALRQGDIRPDHTVPSTTHATTWWAYIATLMLTLLLAIGLDWLLRAPLLSRIRLQWSTSMHQRNKHIAAAQEALRQGNARTFYTALEQALTAANVAPAERDNLLSCRYAPDANDAQTMAEVLQKAQNLIK